MESRYSKTRLDALLARKNTLTQLQEQEVNSRQRGFYSPEQDYITKARMNGNNKNLWNVLLPQYRQYWGYEYFMPLLPGAPARAEAEQSDWLYKQRHGTLII